jgi:hypothetical protein
VLNQQKTDLRFDEAIPLMTGDFMKKKSVEILHQNRGRFRWQFEAPKLDRPQPTHKWISNKIRDQKPINWIDVSNPLNFACQFSVGGSLKTILWGEMRWGTIHWEPHHIKLGDDELWVCGFPRTLPLVFDGLVDGSKSKLWEDSLSAITGLGPPARLLLMKVAEWR